MKNVKSFNFLARSLLLSFALVLSSFAHAADPSMSEVYRAAESGNFSQAEAMMKQVLADHPNSAKAHFVHAEILAKEGRMAAAKDELQIAEKLAPGLPFAKPEAVQGLQARLNAPTPVAPQASNNAYTNSPSAPSGSGLLPWVLGFAALAFIFFIVRMMTRPREIYSPMPGYGGNSGALQPGGYGPTPMGGPGMMGGGGSSMGSGIMGGLATGAAIGAGMVAGEALMHNVLGDHHNSNTSPMPGQGFQDNGFQPTPSSNYDMGGSNFGVSDSSSWDDSSSGGGSDDW
jgi:hypothetical protein